jgi:hypothetical protein
MARADFLTALQAMFQQPPQIYRNPMLAYFRFVSNGF